MRRGSLASRLAAAALAAALAAGLVFGLGLPAAEFVRTLGAERAELSERIARFRAELATPPPAGRATVAGALMAPGSAARAAADLQSLVDEAIRASGATRQIATVEAPEPLEGAERVRLTIDASFTAESLQAFLHRIETGVPFLWVETLDLRPAEPGWAGGAGATPEAGADGAADGAPAPAAPGLIARLTVSALVAAPGDP